MNQKNIFTAIAVVLILQGLGFFVMGAQIAADAFPNVDAAGQGAVKIMLEVMAALSISFGLVAFATRTYPGVVGMWTLGSAILLLVTLKHMFVDNVNVPIPALAIQVLMVLASGYLWMSQRRGVSVQAA